MKQSGETLFEAFLNQHDTRAWEVTVKSLLPHIHEVDKNATQIWFYFFPLKLAKALQQSEDPEKLAKKLLMLGKYHLKDQIDRSHEFLYGHRYWSAVKKAIQEHAASSKAPSSLELAAQIKEVAGRVASELKVDNSLLLGIVAVGFLTLQQVGIEAFKASSGKISLSEKVIKKSPDQIFNARAKDEGQGILGFLKTVDKVYNVTFNENKEDCRYKLLDGQDLATAAASDKRDYRSKDPRCPEGPIPVECRAASCGTCWVGILGGAEKLDPVSSKERKMMPKFGYIDTEDQRPLIRLGCFTPAHGSVSIVIPPWNGYFGQYLRSLEDENEESNHTTA
ncbi:MAG: 2Fe-2S iron-sulfur cluster binding domain-containing protein [Blastocatellia bacterium]|nr:2Fe-2S iron-sulfur cluster binding domain-containing protein [Blastocatellia bacterium]